MPHMPRRHVVRQFFASGSCQFILCSTHVPLLFPINLQFALRATLYNVFSPYLRATGGGAGNTGQVVAVGKRLTVECSFDNSFRFVSWIGAKGPYLRGKLIYFERILLANLG